jgi:hypothetical protein
MCDKLVHSTMHRLHHIVISWKSQYVVMKGLKSYVFAWRSQTLMLKIIALTFGEEIVTLIFGSCIDSKSLCCSLKNVVQQKCALCFMFLQIQTFWTFISRVKSHIYFSFLLDLNFMCVHCAPLVFCFFTMSSSTLLMQKNFKFKPTFPIPNVNLKLASTLKLALCL